MSKKWRCFPILAALALLAGSGVKAQSTSINLKQAIDLALTNNYSLKSDSLNLVNTQNQNKITRADLLPQISYSSKSEYNLALPSQMLPGKFVGQPGKDYVPVQMGSQYSIGSGVEVNQLLYSKSTGIRVNASGLNNRIAQTQHKLTREELVYQVARAYYALQADAELIRTTEHDYTKLLEIVTIGKVQFENGVMKRIDYESLQINAANKESYLKQYKTQYTDHLANFNYLLGIPADNPTVIDQEIPEFAAALEEGNLGSQREDLRLAAQLIESKEVDINAIRAEKKPTISSYFKFNYQAQFNEAGKMFNNDYWFKSSAVGVTVSLPIFDGNRRKTRVAVAQTQLQQLRLDREYQTQMAKTDWVKASATLDNYKDQYRITSRNLELAEKVFNSRKSLYAEGVSTLIELLDAERELSSSRNLYIQALINVQASQVDLYKANGTLMTEFIKTL